MVTPIFFIFTKNNCSFRTELRDKKGGALSNIKRPRENNTQPALSSKTPLFFKFCSPSIHLSFSRILPFLLNLMRLTHEKRSRHEKRTTLIPQNNHQLDFCLLVSVSVLHSDFALIAFFNSLDYFIGPLSLENLHLLQIKFQNKRR